MHSFCSNAANVLVALQATIHLFQALGLSYICEEVNCFAVASMQNQPQGLPVGLLARSGTRKQSNVRWAYLLEMSLQSYF